MLHRHAEIHYLGTIASILYRDSEPDIEIDGLHELPMAKGNEWARFPSMMLRVMPYLRRRDYHEYEAAHTFHYVMPRARSMMVLNALVARRVIILACPPHRYRLMPTIEPILPTTSDFIKVLVKLPLFYYERAWWWYGRYSKTKI